MKQMRNKRNFIKDARLARGWTTKQLADEMTKAGCYINHDTVRRHERGVRSVSPVQQVAYTFVLKRRLDELFEGYSRDSSNGVVALEGFAGKYFIECSVLFRLQEHGGGFRYRSRREKAEVIQPPPNPNMEWQEVSEEARSSKLPVVP